MSKAIKRLRRTPATRKSEPMLPAPFRLNREGRAALAVHLRQEHAYRTSEAAIAAERSAALAFKQSREGQEFEYSPATRALRDKWIESMRATSEYMGALADRIGARKKRTAADAVTLLIAGMHSNRARHPLTEALDSSLGLGLTRT